LDEICQVRRPLHTLKIWGAGVNSPRSYGAEFVFLFFLFVRHATLLGTESPDGAYTYWTWGERSYGPRTVSVIVPIFVLVLVLVLVVQQAATYSIAAVAGNWTILVERYARLSKHRTQAWHWVNIGYFDFNSTFNLWLQFYISLCVCVFTCDRQAQIWR